MEKANKFEVGQEVWWVPGRSYLGKPCFAVVGKVGRKWIYIIDGSVRFEESRLLAEKENGYQMGRVYLKKQDHDDELRLLQLTHKIKSHFQRHGNNLVTLDQAEKIMEILDVNKNT